MGFRLAVDLSHVECWIPPEVQRLQTAAQSKPRRPPSPAPGATARSAPRGPRPRRQRRRTRPAHADDGDSPAPAKPASAPCPPQRTPEAPPPRGAQVVEAGPLIAATTTEQFADALADLLANLIADNRITTCLAPVGRNAYNGRDEADATQEGPTDDGSEAS
jgi:hypothetical protein